MDYVNDPLDLTPRSVTQGGIPDEILQFIAQDLVDWLASNLKERSLEKQGIQEE
ncbi:MAG: hypothetical protein ACXU93_02875 [Thermodesulfobacteriota bacterium]